MKIRTLDNRKDESGGNRNGKKYARRRGKKKKDEQEKKTETKSYIDDGGCVAGIDLDSGGICLEQV